MLGNEKPQVANFQEDYALRSDFCQAFENNMQSLYLLAFLLTANHKDAEQSFAATVEEAMNERAIFKDWVQSWIKRCLVKNAIQIASPVSPQTSHRDSWAGALDTLPHYGMINAITGLAPLDRFVFVMSALERYSDWDCSLLLGCSVSKVMHARLRALRRLPALEAVLPGFGSAAPPLLEVTA